MSDIIRDPPCPLCKREGEWCGPDGTDESTEQHRCSETSCPVSWFRFNQETRTYPDIDVRSLTCQFDEQAWNNASIGEALHEKDPNWEEKIINEQ